MQIEKKYHMVDYSYRKVRVKISPLTEFALNEEQSLIENLVSTTV